MPIAPDDVAFNKAAIIERACQAAIDLALHLVARGCLGMPQSSSDAFKLLHRSGLIDETIMGSMVAMTGFRDVVVHEYQALDLGVFRAIMDGRWRSLIEFCAGTFRLRRAPRQARSCVTHRVVFTGGLCRRLREALRELGLEAFARCRGSA